MRGGGLSEDPSRWGGPRKLRNELCGQQSSFPDGAPYRINRETPSVFRVHLNLESEAKFSHGLITELLSFDLPFGGPTQ